MKNPWILASVLLFVCVAASAQTPPSQPPLSREALAAILGLPAAGSCAAAQPGGVREVAKRPAIPLEKALCTASVTCLSGSLISCSSNISASNCTAVNPQCSSNEPGHVTCDGVTTSCPACVCSTLQNLQDRRCCMCAQTDDCVTCCLCDGHAATYCRNACS